MRAVEIGRDSQCCINGGIARLPASPRSDKLASMGDPIPQFIRDLMPDADEAALQAALENVRAYLRAVERIHQRLINEAGGDSTKFKSESESPDEIR